MSKRPKKGNGLAGFVASIEKQYGDGSIKTGRWKRSLNAIPTGSLALDFELGTGGWPRGHLVGVYGRRDIGKSTTVGLSAVREAQALGLNAAWIALEPSFDVEWAEKHGVNMDMLAVLWPRTGEEAFEMLYKAVDQGPEMELGVVIFDSVGAVQSESEIQEDGTAKVGGASRLISWGTNRVAPLAHRNNVCVLLLNQIRDDMKSRISGQVRQPGGHAIEHLETIIMQLKPGKERYTIKLHGTDVEIGRQVIAHIQRNKLNEGSGQKAMFDFYAKDTNGDYPFGIDLIEDVIATGKRTGTIKQRGAYYDLPDGTSHNGKVALAEYIDATPQAYEACREAILEVMVSGNSKTVMGDQGQEDDTAE